MNINSYISARAKDIPPFLAMDVLDKAKRLEAEGREIIHLELGEPDFPTPENVTEAALRAVKAGYTSYTPTQGLPELRQAVAHYYRCEYDLEVDPERVIITMGSSPAMFLIFGALLNPGDELLIPNPHYPPYPANIAFLGAKPVKFDLREEDSYCYRPEVIRDKISGKTRGLLINSPSNPTGMVQNGDSMQALAELCEEAGIFPISDEIYHGLTYSVRAPSILEYTDRAFVMNGFSKRFAMTGWRLGWIIAPEEFIPALKNLHMNYFLSAAGFAQMAGVEALQNCRAAADEMRATYQLRRDYLVREFRRLGFNIPAAPNGAFYLLVDFRHISDDSPALAERLLEEAGLAVTPGIDFGSNAEGYIRISYATAMNDLQRAVKRLEKFI